MIQEVLSIHSFEPDLIKEIEEKGFQKKVKAGEHVLDTSVDEKVIPFVLEGLLKVYKYRSDGSKVLLYYLEKGETCSMSVTCCLEKRAENIQVIAEEDSRIWMIPNSNLDQWITKYPSFRRFVLNSYQLRFDELMETIDSLVFSNMEDRLFKYLLDTKQATESYEIHKTHQQIADELSTSRVVISRLLKKLEMNDKISQHRNRIEIL
ncbi:Crp/Fnr family transcriptional regulator [Ekhidna sp. To15]|uniref:Crp/Fnr family transcriptional regulator n=1 Tax=Ekhidna sp. To15 TaxID=3395267 RepID=UPI003F527124